ncbi:MAG: hypothetical protein ACOC44_02935 [Promethearchaeia archaeon]
MLEHGDHGLPTLTVGYPRKVLITLPIVINRSHSESADRETPPSDEEVTMGVNLGLKHFAVVSIQKEGKEYCPSATASRSNISRRCMPCAVYRDCQSAIPRGCVGSSRYVQILSDCIYY